ncbi:MAG: hypothetical protein Q7V62_07265, partial [Actinomycetota bacterium]|nr:hypothetical protein [Actinomycetota bacterium]
GTTPLTSSANFSAYLTKASFVMALPNADGNICFRSPTRAHLVVDLVGHLPEAAAFAPAVTRILQSRGGPVLGGRVIEIPLGPFWTNNATTAMLGLVVVTPAAAGYITAFRCGDKIDAVSMVNFVAGANINNVAIAPIDGIGRVCLFVSQNVRLVVDLYGSFVP